MIGIFNSTWYQIRCTEYPIHVPKNDTDSWRWACKIVGEKKNEIFGFVYSCAHSNGSSNRRNWKDKTKWNRYRFKWNGSLCEEMQKTVFRTSGKKQHTPRKLEKKATSVPDQREQRYKDSFFFKKNINNGTTYEKCSILISMGF